MALHVVGGQDTPTQGALDPVKLMATLGAQARGAARALALSPTDARNKALTLAAAALRRDTAAILAANAIDMKAARERGLDAAMLDRLELSTARVEAMAQGLDDIAALPDPVGETIAQWQRPNGLNFARVRVPIGVIGVIYESRPSVTADAGALCLKSGNAVILRGGSESFHSSRAIAQRLRDAIAEAGLPTDAIQLVPTTDRALVGAMLSAMEWIDLVVPRGGRSLIERVTAESRVPVLKHYDGLCHVYVDRDADPAMAVEIVANAKMRRTGVCGAAETLLIDRQALKMLPDILAPLFEVGCEVRGDAEILALESGVVPASEVDWDTEYLDAIISVRVVDGLDQAIAHVNLHGSHHTDAILTQDDAAAERFLNEVDSAIVLHNASTQYADGGEFGMGAEIGISNGKLHARGPVGVEQLTTYKYKVFGTGQVRP